MPERSSEISIPFPSHYEPCRAGSTPPQQKSRNPESLTSIILRSKGILSTAFCFLEDIGRADECRWIDLFRDSRVFATGNFGCESESGRQRGQVVTVLPRGGHGGTRQPAW